MINGTTMLTVSPPVNQTHTVVLTASGNGQNYGADMNLYSTQQENTFTYHADMVIDDLQPQAGPTSGNTRVRVKGFGFRQFRYANGVIREDVPLYAKFIDAQSSSGDNIGNDMKISEFYKDSFIFLTPKASAGTQAILMLSFNMYFQALG